MSPFADRLVIDVGKSQTRLREHPLGRTIVGEGASPSKLREADSGEYLASVVLRCWDASGSDNTSIEEVAIGTTFLPDSDELEKCRSRLKSVWHGAAIHIVDDGVLAHAAALSGPGTVASIGTGIVVVGKGASSPLYLSDGWGPGLGDRGSAFDIGMNAMRHFCRVQDGVDAPTQLASELRIELSAELDVFDANDLFHKLATPSDVAALALVVIGAAERGDTAALELLESAVSAVVDTCAAMSRRARCGTVVICGRLVDASFYRELLEDSITARGLDVRPAMGSVLDAPAGVISGAYAHRAKRLRAAEVMSGENW